MPYIASHDDTDLYVKDWGTDRPVVMLHGQPLSSDTFDDVGMAIADADMRVIAYDRRGFRTIGNTEQGLGRQNPRCQALTPYSLGRFPAPAARAGDRPRPTRWPPVHTSGGAAPGPASAPRRQGEVRQDPLRRGRRLDQGNQPPPPPHSAGTARIRSAHDAPRADVRRGHTGRRRIDVRVGRGPRCAAPYHLRTPRGARGE